MCGRFSLTADPAQLAIELDAVDEASSPAPGLRPAGPPRSPRYNIAPTTTVTVLARDVPRERAETGGASRVLRAMRWGLVPSWATESSSLPTLFNARSETAAEKPSFRAAVARRRCVVPMDGWFEWTRVEPPGGGRPYKQPHFMSAPGDGGLLMAGLWEAREGGFPGESGGEAAAEGGATREGETGDRVLALSCSILTTAALGPLRRVHDRMPLVVPRDAVDDWLDPDGIGDPRELAAGAGGVDLEEWAEQIEIRTVSRAVSSVRNDGPELLRPVDEVVDDGRLF